MGSQGEHGFNPLRSGAAFLTRGVSWLRPVSAQFQSPTKRGSLPDAKIMQVQLRDTLRMFQSPTKRGSLPDATRTTRRPIGQARFNPLRSGAAFLTTDPFILGYELAITFQSPTKRGSLPDRKKRRIPSRRGRVFQSPTKRGSLPDATSTPAPAATNTHVSIPYEAGQPS